MRLLGRSRKHSQPRIYGFQGLFAKERIVEGNKGIACTPRTKQRNRSTPRPVILSEDSSLRGERNEQSQSKDPYTFAILSVAAMGPTDTTHSHL